MKFRSVFSGYPEIELAFQYGSSVRKNLRKAKDVDIALLLKKIPSVERRLEIQSEIAGLLEKEFKKPVDAVLLNSASPFLAHQVIKYGKLLFGKKSKARDFIVKTLTRYFDVLLFHRFFLERLEKRLGVQSNGR